MLWRLCSPRGSEAHALQPRWPSLASAWHSRGAAPQAAAHSSPSRLRRPAQPHRDNAARAQRQGAAITSSVKSSERFRTVSISVKARNPIRDASMNSGEICDLHTSIPSLLLLFQKSRLHSDNFTQTSPSSNLDGTRVTARPSRYRPLPPPRTLSTAAPAAAPQAQTAVQPGRKSGSRSGP